jgi:outer membrane protein
MKKIFLYLLLVFLSFSTFAQKIAYVDSDEILARLPEYNAAQQQLDNISLQWQKEIEGKYEEIDKLYRAYQAEKVLLTEQMRQKRENEIIAKEKEAKDLQKKKFGVDGELFKKRQELIKPIQDRVYTAIQEVAKKKKYAIVFDKAGSLTMLYASDKYDANKEVLDELGVDSKESKKDSKE